MKIKTKVQNSYLVVKTKIPFKQKLDKNELERFAQLGLRGYLKPERWTNHRAQYRGPVAISLRQRLEQPVNRRDFLFILAHLAGALQSALNSRMPMGFVLWDLDHIYINEATRELQFLYLPLMTDCDRRMPVAFLQQLCYAARPDPAQKDSEFILRFIQFFKSQRAPMPKRILDFIAQEDKALLSVVTKSIQLNSGFMTNKRSHYEQHYQAFWASSTEDMPVDDDEDTGILDTAGSAAAEDDEDTGILAEAAAPNAPQSEGDQTCLLDDTPAPAPARPEAPPSCPWLLRQRTGEKFYLSKPVVRVGKERSQVDFFIADNSAISRSHADLITRGKRYFVMDLGSLNHCFINGSMLPARFEAEIRNGDTLRLADEEFLFVCPQITPDCPGAAYSHQSI